MTCLHEEEEPCHCPSTTTSWSSTGCPTTRAESVDDRPPPAPAGGARLARVRRWSARADATFGVESCPAVLPARARPLGEELRRLRHGLRLEARVTPSPAQSSAGSASSGRGPGVPMTNVPPHPAEFSPEVIDVLAELIRPGEHVHDPYGGRGLRLGALCDRLGAIFTATDIEEWPGSDPRVALGNAEDAADLPGAAVHGRHLADVREQAPQRLRQGRSAPDDAAAWPARLRHLARSSDSHPRTRRGSPAAMPSATAEPPTTPRTPGRSSTGATGPSSTSTSRSPSRWCELLDEHGYTILAA